MREPVATDRDVSFDPEDLQGIYDMVASYEAVTVTDELRLLIEQLWPELLHKLIPPRAKMH